jgi:hypothetical protein
MNETVFGRVEDMLDQLEAAQERVEREVEYLDDLGDRIDRQDDADLLGEAAALFRELMERLEMALMGVEAATA